jgi:pimeloyl-ACP methyl ester carboxylesterase
MDMSTMEVEDVPGLSAARPVVYSNLPGLFTAADGACAKNLAVLFVSPWGLEEFLTRKFFRYLAERFAAEGIASLRFDLPGTGNASDSPSEDGIEAFANAISASAEQLRALSGVSRIVVLGQGLGAALAYRFAAEAGDIAGLALLAPVVKGRNYLRELKLWSKFVDDGLGLKPEDRDSTPGTIAGIDMPERLAAELKGFNVTGLEICSEMPVMLAPRPEIQVDPDLNARLVASGCIVTNGVYKDYDTLLSGVSPPELPRAFAEDLVTWLRSLPEWAEPSLKASRAILGGEIEGGHYRETPLRFGDNNRLIGTLCKPAGQSNGVTAVILSTSYDYQIGWGRTSVQLARRLAENGVTSLRFDGADIGDSPPVPGRRPQVLYTAEQVEDAELAFQALEALGLSDNCLVIGRCSGAYTAFRTALNGGHWKGCVVVNSYGFHWRFIGLPGTLQQYWARARGPGVFARLLAGRIHVRAVGVNIIVRLLDRLSRRLGRFIPQLPGIVQRNRKVRAAFRKLEDHGTRLAIVYSEGDEAMASFLIHFGRNAEGLAAFSNARLHLIPNADHNLTPRPAREELFRIVLAEADALAAAAGGTNRQGAG